MKAEIDLQKHFLFVSDEIHSWILPGQLNIDLYSSSLYVNHLSVFLGIPVENSVHYKCHSRHLELTWQQSELNSIQTKTVCVHQVHYRPLWQPRMIATSRMSQITSFQPASN